MWVHGAASDLGSWDGLTETERDELDVGSSRVWAEVGGKLNAASAGILDEGLGAALDGSTAGVSEDACEDELAVVFEDRLEGVSAGESKSVLGGGSDTESVGQSVTVGLGVCAGVGSCGSVHTVCPSATYHTSLCLFNSFRGLGTQKTQQLQPSGMSTDVCIYVSTHTHRYIYLRLSAFVIY